MQLSVCLWSTADLAVADKKRVEVGKGHESDDSDRPKAKSKPKPKPKPKTNGKNTKRR